MSLLSAKAVLACFPQVGRNHHTGKRFLRHTICQMLLVYIISWDLHPLLIFLPSLFPSQTKDDANQTIAHHVINIWNILYLVLELTKKQVLQCSIIHVVE